jgi:Ca2+/Na+ antiporter
MRRPTLSAAQVFGGDVVQAVTPVAASGLFVGFSDNRRLAVVVRFVVFVLGIVVIIVRVSWWNRCCPMMVMRLRTTNQLETFSGDARGHVGLLLDVTTFAA